MDPSGVENRGEWKGSMADVLIARCKEEKRSQQQLDCIMKAKTMDEVEECDQEWRTSEPIDMQSDA